MAASCSPPWPDECPLSWTYLMDPQCDCGQCSVLGPTMDSTYVSRIEKHVSSGNYPHPKSLNQLVFDGDIEGTTPLLLACKQEDLDVVRHIVESWEVDFRAAAPFHIRIFDEESWYGNIVSIEATPLFIAAMYGNYNIVRYLVEKGADSNIKVVDPPNDTDYDNWAPIDFLFKELCSCNWSHVPEQRQDLVLTISFLLQYGSHPPSQPLPNGDPVWMERSCDAQVLRELINHGMNVNTRHRGRTVLHYWASLSESSTNDTLAAVRLLMDRGADLMARDRNGLTPIRVAAEVEPFNFGVFDLLLDGNDIGRLTKIQALELAGATILSAYTSVDARIKAFDYWRRAAHLRLLNTQEFQPLPKLSLKRQSGNQGEWNTLVELEAVIQNSSEHYKQAFLVRLRIGYANRDGKGALLSSFTSFIDRYLTDAQEELISEELLDAAFAILEMISQDPTPPWNSCDLLYDVVRILVSTLSSIQESSPQLFNYGMINTALDLMAKTDHLHSLDNCGNYSIKSYMMKLLDLADILVDLPQMLGDAAIQASFSQLLSPDRRDEMGRTLLHVALLDTDKKHVDLPALIRLLLHYKIDFRAVDEEQKGPLHYLAKSKTNDQQLLAAVLLLEIGADLMARDDHGYTPIRVAAEMDPINFDIFEFFLERSEINRVDKIEALELAGAVILTSSIITSPDARDKAFDYWRRALQLQLSVSEENQPLPKTPLKRKNGNSGEWVMSSQLENIIQHPLEYKKQAFLVRMRIGSVDQNWTNTFSSSLSSFIDRYLTKLQKELRYEELLDATFTVLETVSHYSMRPWNSWDMLVDVVRILVTTLSTIQESSPELFNIEVIKMSLDLMVETDRHSDGYPIECYMKILLDLVGMIASLPQMIEDNEDKAVLAFLTYLLRWDWRDERNRSLLHLVLIDVAKTNSDPAAIIRLLLLSKVDPNGVDEERRAPPHYLADHGTQEQFKSIGRLLSKYGADLDQVNLLRKTALDIYTGKYLRKRLLDADHARAAEWDELPDWCHQVPKLRCLCARRIRSRVHSRNISSLGIPVTLNSFLENH